VQLRDFYIGPYFCNSRMHEVLIVDSQHCPPNIACSTS
jgi:hypothetical protein